HHSDPYLLPFLRDEDSWELLQKKVFQGESCPSELLNVGPLVAKKCKGLPYLIIMIAGILSRKKREPSLWLEIAYDISSHALAEESMKVIQLSYDCLEDHLKSCLLYMGLFPKGYEIPVSDLLKWWIAEEFVQNIDMLELEETSKSFLDDLVNRNLTLGVCYISVADMTPKFWEKFPNLEELRLHINEFGDVPNYSGRFDFPLRLKVLSLSEIFLTDEMVSSIAKLQHLETLKLSKIYFTGEKKWDVIDNSCPKLEEIPLSFADIMLLRSIKVIDCSDSVGSSAVRIKHEIEEIEGFDRLQVHIMKKD
ncbi:hypothetical protein HAX54_047723, partial [Datura stramonium]|nr:hypothetical protein [Datura stramonium]